MPPSLKIRRSGAYGIAGAIVLMGSMFLPMSTPQWFVTAAWCLVAGFAGGAVFCSARERKARMTGRSVGFFALAILIIIVAALAFLTSVL
jgi:uncharacterized membrane protein SirB2